MKLLFHLAAELQEFFLQHEWEFCFIGGVALQWWGEPRLTRDVDVTLLTGFTNETSYVEALCARYHPRISNAVEFASVNRVLLLESDRHIPIDIALAGFPYEEAVVRRAKDVQFTKGIVLRLCSPEDLVVLKAFADRNRDWGDIESILLRQKGSLDWPYVLRQLGPLCQLKEAPEIVERLKDLREKMK